MNDDNDGWVPATGRNLVAEKRARLELAATGKARRIRGRKSGDPRIDRARADARRAVLESRGPVAL